MSSEAVGMADQDAPREEKGEKTQLWGWVGLASWREGPCVLVSCEGPLRKGV